MLLVSGKAKERPLAQCVGLLTTIVFQFSKCYTEFGAFAKTNTTHQGTKMFYLEKDTTFIASKFKKLLLAAVYGL